MQLGQYGRAFRRRLGVSAAATIRCRTDVRRALASRDFRGFTSFDQSPTRTSTSRHLKATSSPSTTNSLEPSTTKWIVSARSFRRDRRRLPVERALADVTNLNPKTLPRTVDDVYHPLSPGKPNKKDVVGAGGSGDRVCEIARKAVTKPRFYFG